MKFSLLQQQLQQLVSPNFLKSTDSVDSVAITITVAMDPQVANSGDHDLQVMEFLLCIVNSNGSMRPPWVYLYYRNFG